MSYYIHSTFPIDTVQQQQYPLYLSNPWSNHSINATLTNLCIKSSEPSNTNIPCDICEAEIKCGQQLNGELSYRESGSKYYYFNLSHDLSFIIFDSCGSLYNRHMDDNLYNMDLYLYDMNFTMLYQGDNSGVCTNKEELSIQNLEAGQYILGVDYWTRYSSSEWEISVICEDEIKYSYKPRFGSTMYWIDAEIDCEQQYGTSLATIITEKDMTDALNVINNVFTELHDLTIIIGLYKDATNNSRWKWVDGTSCEYTETGDCIDDMHWKQNHPSVISDPSDRVPFVGGYLSIPAVGNANTSYIYDAYEFWGGSFGNVGWLCNAPIDGNYATAICTHLSKCWHNMECCNNSIVVEYTQYESFEFKPIIAYWDLNMYIIGPYQIHYTNINLFNHTYAWSHISFETFNYTQYIERVTFTQYRSSLYLFIHRFDYTPDRLIHIDLDTIYIQSYTAPDTTHLSDGDCMVATQEKVYIFRESFMLTFDTNTTQWIITYFDAGIDIMPYTCSITNNYENIYVFGLLVSAGWIDGVIKFDISTQEFSYLETAGLCSVNSATAVTATNDKIYLHGCYAASWKTLIFDPNTQKFENETINIGYPTDTSYFRTGRMAVFDDNVLLLLVPRAPTLFGWEQIIDFDNYEMTLYSAITDTISINFTQTNTLKYIWPSDGLEIKYYLNDFSNGTGSIYHIWLYSENNGVVNINASIILNVTNDNCVCKVYNCHDCYQKLELTGYLSSMSTNINQLQFVPIHYYDFDILFLPKQIAVKLQRCNVSLSTRNPTTNNNKKSIDIDYFLSDNCFSRIGKNFSLNITAATMDIWTTLIINIMNNKTLQCKLCELVNSHCVHCKENTFTIHHKANNIYGAFDMLITSNMVDVHIISSVDSIQHVNSFNKVQSNKNLWYLLFLLVFTLIVVAVVYIYWKKQYSQAFIVNNALVLLVGISQFDDKQAHLPGVQRCIDRLFDLWRNKYNYDVFICNEKSLYSTKRQIQKFADDSLQKLQENDYDCVIVHNISHGTKGKFVTSDNKIIDLQFWIHELQTKAEETDNLKLLKVLFDHSCQGHADYRTPDFSVSTSDDSDATKLRVLNMYQSNSKIEYNQENISFESNFAIVAANVSGRAVSDSGSFSKHISISFQKNVSRIIKWSFDGLIKEIRRNVENETDHAELVTVEENVSYNTVRFEKCKQMEKYIETDNTEIEMYDLGKQTEKGTNESVKLH